MPAEFQNLIAPSMTSPSWLSDAVAPHTSERMDEQLRPEAQARGPGEEADTVALLVAAGLAIFVVCGTLL